MRSNLQFSARTAYVPALRMPAVLAMFSFMAEPAPWPYLELTLLRHMAAGLVVEEIAGETVHARTSEGNAVLVDRCHYERAKARFDRGERAPAPPVAPPTAPKAAPGRGYQSREAAPAFRASYPAARSAGRAQGDPGAHRARRP